MSQSPPEPVTPPEPVAPLPRRDPRPLAVHVAVDTSVAFLLAAVVLLVLSVSIWAVIIIAVVLGTTAAPFTRRAEERALALRPEA